MDHKKKKKDVVEPEIVEETQPVDAQDTAAPDEVETPPAAEPRAPEEEAMEIRLLRLQADFDNFRKRTQREKAEWQLKASEDFLADLLPVLDHYELGLKTAIKQKAEQAVIDGFQMVYDQFIAALRKHRVTPVSAEGKLFDPNQHEAITFVPSEEHPEHAIIAETRRGWQLGDKMLRPAQVVVSSGPAVSADKDEPAAVGEESNA